MLLFFANIIIIVYNSKCLHMYVRDIPFFLSNYYEDFKYYIYFCILIVSNGHT